MPFFTMLMKQNLIMFLKLKNWPIFLGRCPFQIQKIISASLHAFLKLTYFHGRSAFFKSQKKIQQAFMLY
jgi:hypothetical protein